MNSGCNEKKGWGVAAEAKIQHKSDVLIMVRTFDWLVNVSDGSAQMVHRRWRFLCNSSYIGWLVQSQLRPTLVSSDWLIFVCTSNGIMMSLGNIIVTIVLLLLLIWAHEEALIHRCELQWNQWRKHDISLFHRFFSGNYKWRVWQKFSKCTDIYNMCDIDTLF